MKRAAGFTLIELMIVIIIVILLAFMIIALFNEMFRGQGLREGARIVSQGLSDAREMAATERVMHFVKMYNGPDGGMLEIWKDTDGDKQLTGADQLVPGGRIDMPKGCFFKNQDGGVSLGAVNFPSYHWIGFEPTGYCKFVPGVPDVDSSVFDNNWKDSNPNPALIGDVCLEVKGRPYDMALDIDRFAGKVRRMEFRNKGN